MNSALFLLVINMAIGLCFAAGFLALSQRASTRLGWWCAAGFLAATATAATEASGFALTMPRLISTLSFGFLMLAAVFIVAGLRRHYSPAETNRTLYAFGLALAVLNPLVIFELPRGTIGQALAYQLPFAAVFAFGAHNVLARAQRPVDVTVGVILAAVALQFMAKGALGPLVGAGHAPGVADYVFSLYAYYSQTLGSILSLALGVSLFALLTVEVMEEHAQHLQKDALSGLRNRSAFFAEAEAALRRLPARQTAGVVICDLDHFKSVNDRFGHAAGDEVIARFGALLGEAGGKDGIAGRIGGEEFCLLLPSGGLERSTARVEWLRKRLAEARFLNLPTGITVTASFGITAAGAREPLPDALRRADLALYRAKAEGRNDYRIAPTTPH
ncbi:GGDEF domain-containing protein [Aquabacter sp. L1I39]|uniref:GGDEF domain-containing protein n=1 Tax=Aquabacter sp. L1I39 TaxID=2820278 RepID=UPI001ADBA93A|nr:GGDEF domain-containing protein [Aquabacter sp. L1I39]QTL01685.1 GGDEF domain-containing protein [Aquabacter sp. L1I39]